jgi:hypothetical protein
MQVLRQSQPGSSAPGGMTNKIKRHVLGQARKHHSTLRIRRQPCALLLLRMLGNQLQFRLWF